MSSEKTEAIVLRVIDFSETSCVVTLWTRDFGKLTALAKGARRPKSPFEAALDMLAICRVVFLHKSSGAMDLLTEAKLERRFRNRSGNLSHLYAAYYIVELLRNLTEEDDPHFDLYELAVATISQIDNEPFTKDNLTDSDQTTLVTPFHLGGCLLNFEIGALKILGHLPMLTKCVGCGRPRTTQNRVSFGLNDGGLICQSCRPGKTNVISLSPAAVNLMIQLASPARPTNSTLPIVSEIPATSAPPPTTQSLKESNSANVIAEIKSPFRTLERPLNPNAESRHSNADVIREVRSLMNRYISHLLGFEPRTQKYIKSL